MTEWQPAHLDEGELLRFADGELSPRQARRVRTHLGRCWQCRASLAEIERTIRACVEYRRTVFEACMPEPPAPWFDIRRRLAALETRAEARPWSSRLRRGFAARWLAPPRLAVAAAVAAILWAQATLIFHSREPARSTPATVTRAMPPPALPKTKAVPTPSSGPAEPPVTRPREAATASDELRVFALLRRLGADLGEPVEVTREGGRVLVRGVGISPEVESVLSRELEASPRFSVQFVPPATNVPPAEHLVPTVTVRPEITRLQSQLEQRLGGRAAYDELANALLETVDGLLAHVHAIRRLAGRFPPEVESALSREDKAMLASLLRDHASAAAKLAANLEERSRSVFGSFARPGGTAAPASGSGRPWQRAIEEVLGSARRAEALLAAILGGSVSPEPATALPGEFLSSVEELRRQADALLRGTAE